MLTEFEKDKAIQVVRNLASIIVNHTEGALYYKIIASYMAIAYPQSFSINKSSLLKNDDMIDSLSKMILHIISVATEGTLEKHYTTGQLSKFFGVSVTSINNWINEGRFIGMQRTTPKKQIRIPESAIWRSPNGEHIVVKDVVSMWEKEHYNRLIPNEEELAILQSEIGYFEKKYGGTYQNTLTSKKQLDTEADRDEWEYLLYRIQAHVHQE